MSSILIVGCGFPQLSLLRRARERGLFVYGADMNPSAVGVRYANEFIQVSTSDVTGLARAVERTAVTAIATTGSEVALKATAAVALQRGLPFYADPETVRRCQEKGAMRAAYEAGNVSVPAFAQCLELSDATAFAGIHGFPLVVKPARGWGQRGVARVERAADLATAFEEAKQHSATAGLPVVVVEAWLHGREYSVNGWIEDGVLKNYCVTERLTVPGNRPLGVMVAELYPSGLSSEDEALVIAEAAKGAKALGHCRGPCYSQVSFSSEAKHKRAVLFETAARLGGGFDADVTKLASGVDMYDRLLGIALGDRDLEHAPANPPTYGAAVAKFLIGAPGKVRAITGLESARSLPGVVDAEVFVPVGGEVFPLTDSAKRAAYVLAHGSTRSDVIARADKALSTIRMDTSSESGRAEGVAL